MEAGSSSEKLVNIYQTTWSKTPKSSHLHDRALSFFLIILSAYFKNTV
jgi:hypothetical protein